MWLRGEDGLPDGVLHRRFPALLPRPTGLLVDAGTDAVDDVILSHLLALLVVDVHRLAEHGSELAGDLVADDRDLVPRKVAAGVEGGVEHGGCRRRCGRGGGRWAGRSGRFRCLPLRGASEACSGVLDVRKAGGRLLRGPRGLSEERQAAEVGGVGRGVAHDCASQLSAVE